MDRNKRRVFQTREQGERPKYESKYFPFPTMAFCPSATLNEVVYRAMFPIGGKLTNLMMYVEHVDGETEMELVIYGNGIQSSVKFAVQKGLMQIDSAEVTQGERALIRVVKGTATGIWFSYIYAGRSQHG